MRLVGFIIRTYHDAGHLNVRFSLEFVFLKILRVFLVLPYELQVAPFNTLLGLYVLKY